MGSRWRRDAATPSHPLRSGADVRLTDERHGNQSPGGSLKSHITIHDIAEICHVSTATVSRALNDKPGIGAVRREQIIKRARELGYVPDATTQSMRSRRTDCVYLVMHAGSSTAEPLLQLPSHEVFESMLG
ncbi:LacI family DNA-binding transcriptional regulator [Bifidobacterium mongoliense]|uniref:LacI family DNA-binding transcriptional regulator n=1 Tax=Bifidobacterium mongoliense TaxID=518643 RepID=UPI003BEF3DCA